MESKSKWEREAINCMGPLFYYVVCWPSYFIYCRNGLSLCLFFFKLKINRWMIKWNCCSTHGQTCWFWITFTSGCIITCQTNRRCLTDRSLTCSRCRCLVVQIWSNHFMTLQPDSPRFALTFLTTFASSFSCFSILVSARLCLFPLSSFSFYIWQVSHWFLFFCLLLSLSIWLGFYIFFDCPSDEADVKGLMNRRHVVEAQEQVQQALFDYTLNCYSHIPVSVNFS